MAVLVSRVDDHDESQVQNEACLTRETTAVVSHQEYQINVSKLVQISPVASNPLSDPLRVHA